MAAQGSDRRGAGARRWPGCRSRASRESSPALALSDDARYEIDFRLSRKEEQFQQAIVLAYGMRFEALADDGVVMRGEPLKLSFAVANHGPADVTVAGVDLAGLTGASADVQRRDQEGLALTPARAPVTIPATPAFTGPYWTPRTDAARYDFDPDAPFGLPFRPSPFKATFHVSVGGADDSDPARSAVPLRQRRRGREADGALGGAGVLRAACAGHRRDLPAPRGRSARRIRPAGACRSS